MRLLFDRKTSLRTRLTAGISIMLIPLCALVIGGAIAIRGAITELEGTVYQPTEKLIYVTDVQKLLHKSKWPVQQFSNRLEQSDRTQFDSLSVEIGLAFEAGFSNTNLNPREHELFTTAKHEWLNLHAVVKQFFEEANNLSTDQHQNVVLNFARGLDRTIHLLEEVESLVLTEIQAQRLAAHDVKWKSIIFVTVILIIGLSFALLGAYILYRAVISPLRTMEHTVNRFGQGDLSSRVNLETNDELGHLALAFNSMAERFQKVQTELDYLSIHDSLTGLYDRPQFHDIVAMEMHRAKRYKRSFALLFIDIEEFRDVNDSYGHLVGDSVLCSVAMQINNTIRPTDTAARYGGDEFAVILSETTVEGARETADRIGKAIAHNPLNIGDGKSLTISVSIGVASYPDDADSESALFAQAESALERAKRSASQQPNQTPIYQTKKLG